MRRIGWLVCLTAAVLFGRADRASASPLQLAIWGYADALSIRGVSTVDVTNGFSKYTTGGSHMLMHQWEPEDWTRPIDASMSIRVRLYDGDQFLAEKDFSGSVTGTLYYWGRYGRFDASARGFSEGDLEIAQGVDPSLIPLWFTGLTATVNTTVDGGRENWYGSTLTLAVAPVPEPSSVLVFLAAAGFVGYRRHRVRGSAGASPSR